MPDLPVPKGKQIEVLALPGTGHHVVLGTAGSGKTTMAVHRAALLASEGHSKRGPVLLVTFNRTLLAYLEYWRPPGLEGVTFENFHAFARGYLGSLGRMGQNCICATDAVRQEYVRKAVAAVRRAHKDEYEALFIRPLSFFEEEIRFIDRYGLIDEEAYVESDRFGRGAGFSRDLRPVMLEIHRAYAAARTRDGYLYDWDDMARHVREALSQDTSDRMYRHIVIDEGQDFSPEMLRALALAIPQDGSGSLTFFGDMAQQIYGRQVSWSRSGLIVPQGVWRFKRNYRNTPEIAELGLAISDMPYFADTADMVQPDEFEPSGPRPSFVKFRSTTDETEWVIARAQEGAQTGSVGVLARRRQDLYRFQQAFPGAQRLHRHMAVWLPGPGISYGGVHAAKGFEFDTVILVGLQEASWPEPMAVASEGRAVAEASDGKLLYVAVTRARRELVMTCVGQPTSLLPPNNGLWLEEEGA